MENVVQFKPTCTSACKLCGDPQGIAVKFAGRIEHICVPCGRKIREGSLMVNADTMETIEVLS